MIVSSNVQPVESQLHDLSLDPYSRHIYWTCETTNSINIQKMNGHTVGVVLKDDTNKPRAIVVNAAKGWAQGLFQSGFYHYKCFEVYIDYHSI